MNIQTPSMLARSNSTPGKAEVPTLKLWFKANEEDGDTALIDDIIGLAIPGEVTKIAGNNYVEFLSTDGGFSRVAIAETFPAIESRDFMLLVAGRMGGTESFVLGDTANAHIRVASAFTNTLDDGTTASYAAGSMSNDSNDHSWVLTVDEDSATGFNSYQDSITPTGTDSLTSPNIQPITLAQFATVDITRLYSVMLFVFDTALSATEWESALSEGLWMMDQARLGNKVLSPRATKWV